MLFDEPNSALTPDESAEFFRLIRQLADAGHVVMLISHRLTELAANSDRVAIILDGRCVRLLEGADRTRGEHRRDARPRARRDAGRRAGRRPPAQPRTTARRSSSSASPTTGGRSRTSTSRSRRAGSPRSSASRARAGASSCARCGGLRRVQGRGAGRRPRRPPVAAPRARQLRRRRPRVEPLLQPDRRREPRHPPRPRDLARRARPPPPQDARDRRGAADELPGQGGRDRHRRSARCAAATSRRSRSPPRSGAARACSRSRSRRAGSTSPARPRSTRSSARFAADGGAVLLFCTEIPEVYEVADRLHVVSDGQLSAPLEVGVVRATWRRSRRRSRASRRTPRPRRDRRRSRWTPTSCIDLRSEVGEGPLWDHRSGRLLFVDVFVGHLYLGHARRPRRGRRDRTLARRGRAAGRRRLRPRDAGGRGDARAGRAGGAVLRPAARPRRCG